MPDREPRIPRRPANSPQPQAQVSKPGPRPVVWGSITLFVALFAFLTLQVSAGASPTSTRSAKQKQVATKQSSNGEYEASTDAELGEEPESQYAEPEYAETEYAEPEYAETESEYVEPEPEPEVEYVEPEVEEVPPVVTSSS
jgi:hypothetical protein